MTKKGITCEISLLQCSRKMKEVIPKRIISSSGTGLTRSMTSETGIRAEKSVGRALP